MKRSGFSLIEVNMAVVVLAVGVLSMAMLYPLGLRESMQSQADIKQAMFADYVLNVAVAAACSTNLTWAQWTACRESSGSGTKVFDAVTTAVRQYSNQQLDGFKLTLNQTCTVNFVPAQGASACVMGILVRSLDANTSNMDSDEIKKYLAAQPTYYAEARFQGKAN